jgi:hypothetical protein
MKLSLLHLLLKRNDPLGKRFQVTGGQVRRQTWTIGAALALTACNQTRSQEAGANVPAPAHRGNLEEPVVIPPPRTAADARTPLREPKAAIDPKSVEAAAQVVERYADLVENGRATEAESLWSDMAAASAFTRHLDSRLRVEIGRLGRTEGAAGSIYTTIPVVFSGDPRRKRAEVVLRRINDVPGSTEAERHWHIVRIDFKD